MKFNFKGEINELVNGIDHISNCLDYEVAEDGIVIEVSKCEKGFRVFGNEKGANILYDQKADFFRALSFLTAKVKEGGEFDISQTPNYETLGLMIDFSRNAVMPVKKLQEFMQYMSVMGYNTFSLYLEDMYTLENYPYYGYMRGRYSEEELCLIDSYADDLGIEMLPYVQTLGHLAVPLQWPDCRIPKDTGHIVLVGEEKTYKFLEELIVAATKPFKTNRKKRIFVGMDEAHGIGTGGYRRKNGIKEPFDIVIEHMGHVNKIMDKYGLNPITSTDMFFSEASKHRYYYDTDTVLNPEQIAKIPDNYLLSYWDYQHKEQEKYEKLIDIHKTIGNDIIYSGSVLTYSGLVVNYDVTIPSLTAGNKAALKKGIKETIITMWGDDGAETNFFSALLGMQLQAEFGYTDNADVSNETLRERFLQCTGGNMEDFIAIGKLDAISEEGEMVVDTLPNDPCNPSKWLLFNDPLIGFMDRHIEDYDMSTYYAKVADRLQIAKDRAGKLDFVFDMPLKLAKALVLKSDLGLRITRAYKKGDKEELRKISDADIPRTIELVEEFRKTHRKQWMLCYKPFGWEIIDHRYGGVVARLESSAERIKEYLAGEIDSLAELEEERLFYEGDPRPVEAWIAGEKATRKLGIGRLPSYRKMISAGQTMN